MGAAGSAQLGGVGVGDGVGVGLGVGLGAGLGVAVGVGVAAGVGVVGVPDPHPMDQRANEAAESQAHLTGAVIPLESLKKCLLICWRTPVRSTPEGGEARG